MRHSILLIAFLALPAFAPAQTIPARSEGEQQLYDGAIREPNVEGRIRLLEQFLAQYPKSSLNEKVLEKLVTTYQQAGNGQKVIETNNALLDLSPNNLQALALVVSVRRRAAARGKDAQQNFKLAGKLAERGLMALDEEKKERPEPTDDPEHAISYRVVFEGALGDAALDADDYESAQQHLLRAVQLQPNGAQDNYSLGLAYLDGPSSSKTVTGLWFVARAAVLAEQFSREPHLSEIARNRYVRFHGTQEGWEKLCTQAKNSAFPPSDLDISSLPSSCDVLFTVSRLSDDGRFMTTQHSGLSDDQKIWWDASGKKLFPSFCLVDQPLADYVLLWTSKKDTVVGSSTGVFFFGTYAPDIRTATRAWVFAHRVSPSYREVLKCERERARETPICGPRKILSPALFEIDHDEVWNSNARTSALQEALEKLRKQLKHN